MFKKRSLQVRVIKDTDETMSSTTVGHWHVEPDQINQIVKDQVRSIAIVVGVVVAVKMILNTVNEVVVITAYAKIR